MITASVVTGAAVQVTPAVAATTIDGPDVSSYQHPNGVSINWSAVAASGHEFAIVKATEGTSYVNKYFAGDYAGIRRAGMVRGSYHFAHPAYPVASTALAQAKFYVAHIGSTLTTKTLPPALDLEVTGGLSRAALVTWAQDFLLDVRNLTGRTPMLYTYPYFWSDNLHDNAAFTRYPLWMAGYSGGVDVGATLWQYTAGATVKGIKGPVDMSKVLADPTTWAAMTDGTSPSPWPADAPSAPSAVHVTAGDRKLSVTWLPPDAGSSAVTSYTVTVGRADGTGTPQSISLSSTHASTAVARLANGVPYVVRVTARNAVGTGRASSPQTVTPKWATTLGWTGPTLLSYGHAVTVGAVLRRADTGAPLPGVLVTVQSRPHGGSTWTARGTFTTDAGGRVSRAFTPGRNDDFRFHYAGSSIYQSVSVVREVDVRPVVSAALSSATTAAGHSVVLSGGENPVEAGVRVVSEVLSAGHWRVLQAKTTGLHGGFRFVLTTTRAGYSTYRVVVAATGSRAAGLSPAVVLHTT